VSLFVEVCGSGGIGKNSALIGTWAITEETL